MNVIDLFAGCGGLSLGFENCKFKILTAVEFDPEIAETYKKNHKNVSVVVDDIKNIDKTNLFKKGEADVIIGGPPCQGFSMAGARIRNGFVDDPRNYLFKHYLNVVKKVKPKVFVMENVKGLMTMQSGKIFNEILTLFKDKKVFNGKPYNVYYKIVKCSEFGIPQKRERLVIIGSENKIENFDEVWDKTKEKVAKKYPYFFNPVTVRDAIGNLVDASDDGIIRNIRPTTEYQKYLSSKKGVIQNHTKTNHSMIAIKRIRQVKSGENFTALKEKINSVHSGAYGRLSWDDVAPTITTRFDTPAGGRFIHPSKDRTLTPREAARIQSFPDDFVFYGSKSSICKQIGNAVPPKLSYFLAKFVSEVLKND